MNIILSNYLENIIFRHWFRLIHYSEYKQYIFKIECKWRFHSKLCTILEVCKLTFFIDFLIHIYFTNNKVKVSGNILPSPPHPTMECFSLSQNSMHNQARDHIFWTYKATLWTNKLFRMLYNKLKSATDICGRREIKFEIWMFVLRSINSENYTVILQITCVYWIPRMFCILIKTGFWDHANAIKLIWLDALI